jgi:hypothetical protein
MMTFEITTTKTGDYAVYEVLSDGRRWNCRSTHETAAAATEAVARYTATEERIAAMPRQDLPEDVEFCWECGLPILDGDGLLDGHMGMAHRSCVGA